MFKALLETRFLALMNSMFFSKTASKKKKRGVGAKIGILILAIYVIGAFFMMFGVLFFSICQPLCSVGLGWLYFSLAAIISTLLCFVGSIFATQTQLYESKDNELLLSMPIPPRYILATRMIMLGALNMFYELLIMIPAGVVYCMFYRVTVWGVIIFVLSALLLPLLVLSISSILGWVIALIGSKVRNKNLINMILSVGFLVAYFYAYGQIEVYINKLILNGAHIADAIRKSVFPAYHFGRAIAEADFLSFVMFALCAVVPFAIVYFVLSRSFINISTSKKSAAKIKYRHRSLSVSSAGAALVKKELRHFFGNAMYVLNSSMGIIFTVIMAVAAVLKRDQLLMLLDEIPFAREYTGAVCCIILTVMSSFNIISAPSVSLEGKNLWISQSMPVPAYKVLMAKAWAHIIVCVPSVLIGATVFMFLFKMSAVDVLMMYLLPCVFTVMVGLLGVVINLKLPKFDWISETAVIKQSASTMVTMLISMCIVAVIIVPYFFIIGAVSAQVYISLWVVAVAVIGFLLARYIKKRGQSIFMSL